MPKKKYDPQPMQPLVVDDAGVVRFRKNAIVNWLLECAGKGIKGDMNMIAMLPFDAADREQFAQLIGYSVSGYHELSYVSDASATAASSLARKIGADGGCRDAGCAIHGGKKRTARKPKAKASTANDGAPLGLVTVERSAPRTLNTPADIFDVLRRHAGAEQESFYVVAVNIRNVMLGEPTVVATGTVDGVQVHPRDVFRAAVRANAAGIVVAHNHPSGDPTPSAEDFALTERLHAAGAIVGIPVVDHVVFATGGFRSIAESKRGPW